MPYRKYLVYVLPGIGGSVLQRPTRTGRFETVWDAGFGDITDLMLRPDRLSIAENERLRPTGLIKSAWLLPGWRAVHGYERLVRDLSALPGVKLDTGNPEARVADANVVLFPYDFRRSIVEAAGLLAADVMTRLKTLGDESIHTLRVQGCGVDGARAEAGRRVVVVAHSLGGLVARYWLGPLEGWPVCRALITLGTPHRGAPKALDTVVNGAAIGGRIRLRRPADMLAGWDSIGQLLPAYPAVWDAERRQARYPHDLPLDALRPIAKAGYEVHREINEAWSQRVPRSGPQVRAYFGFSHSTARAAVWSDGRLSVESGPPKGLPMDGWERDLGDGTVPAFCAVPVESSGDDVRGLRVAQRHGPLAVMETIAGILEYFEGRADISAIRGGEGAASALGGDVPPALGVDVDEWHASGTPIRVGVRACGGHRDVSRASVWVNLAPVRDPRSLARCQVTVSPPLRAEWDPGSGIFVCELPGLPPGLYELTVTARAVPGAGDLRCTDIIAVVEP